MADKDYSAILRALASNQASSFNGSPFSQAINNKLAPMGSAVASALMAPGNALRGDYSYAEVNPDGSVNPVNSALLQQANNMAGVVSVSGMPIPKPRGSLAMGMSAPEMPRPTSNYVRDLSADTPVLYREMNPERANNILDNNINVGAVGQDRMYWSDVPELARGQGDNTGIRMKMNSQGVQGKIDTMSKPGLAFVQQTKGGREFVTQDGVSFSKVDEVQVGPEIMFRQSPDDRRLLNRLRQLVDAGEFTASSPDGFVTLYQRKR